MKGHQDRVPMQHYLHLLITYLRPQKFRVLLLGVLLFGGIALQLVNPQVMSHFIDSAKEGSPLHVLFLAAGIYLGISLLQQGVSILATYLGENVAWTATNQLRCDLLEHCLRLDMMFHNQKTPGEMIERIDGDVTALSNVFSKFIFNVLGNLLLLVGVLVALARVDWRSSLSFTAFAVIVLLAINALRYLVVPRWVESRQASAEFFGFVEERLQGIEDVQANGGVPFVMQRFAKVSRNRYQKERKAYLMNALSWSTTSFLFLIGNAMALAIGYYLFKSNAITLGTVYLIFLYTEMLRNPLEQLSAQFIDLQQASASVRRIVELTHLQSRIQDGPGTRIPAGTPSLTCENVSFGYSDNEMILKNISFDLKPGQVLGLIGRTGSGKTTLGRLLFRLYDPLAGHILLNGVDIRQATLHELRSRVGMVTQDVQLFCATIRDNLTFFDPAISDDEILNVLRELGMSEWHDSLPDGLNTMLGANGGGLSAGQGQLLALARVFLRNPDFVLLDEASSRLDPSTEQMLERAMDKLLQNRTAIIIAHRLSTIERADNVIILGDGAIIETGRREDLANDPASRLHQMMRTGMEVTSA